MALVRACLRCPTPTRPIVTSTSAMAQDGVVVVAEVRLCTPCRQKAGQENIAAKARSTGKDVSK